MIGWKDPLGFTFDKISIWTIVLLREAFLLVINPMEAFFIEGSLGRQGRFQKILPRRRAPTWRADARNEVDTS